MAGVKVLVHPRYTFTVPTGLQNGTAVFPLKLGLDATGWVSAVLEVVVYETSITGAASSTTITVVPTFICEDGKPASYGGSALATATVTSGAASSTSRVFLPAQLTTPITDQLTALLTFTAGANAMAGFVEVAVYLVGRSA